MNNAGTVKISASEHKINLVFDALFSNKASNMFLRIAHMILPVIVFNYEIPYRYETLTKNLLKS
jgi:hypothetical protein